MRRNPYKIGNTDNDGRGFLRRKKPTLKGREGRFWRAGLITAAIIVLILLTIRFLKPETQLMGSVEIKHIESKGMLNVGVLNDMPGFCKDGEGLEAELAKLLAKRILPDSDDPIRFTVCTSRTVSAKLSDGSIDVAIALQPRGSGSGYSYSYPYYSDNVYLVALSPENSAKGPSELKIGYIPESSAGTAFKSYVSKVTAVEEQNILDKLMRKPKPTPDPAAAVTIDSVKYGSYDELIAALKRGDIDAAAMSGAHIYKYFKVMAEETGVGEYYLCDTVVGRLDYCMIASSDEPALTQLADMLIYEIQENGLLGELINKYIPGRI